MIKHTNHLMLNWAINLAGFGTDESGEKSRTNKKGKNGVNLAGVEIYENVEKICTKDNVKKTLKLQNSESGAHEKAEFKKADKEKKIDFAVGGQAVIEGVMMRSPNSITIAVRKQNGEIKIKQDKYRTLTQKYKLLNIPILRGVINLFEMMVIGTKAINFSANEAMEDGENANLSVKEEQDADLSMKEGRNFEEENANASKTHPQIKSSESLKNKIGDTIMFAVSLILALAFSIFLFKFIPLWSATLLEKSFPLIKENYIIFNITDGIIKMMMFLGYIFILGLFPSFKRIFEYHGAEHKSIFTYESKRELNVENASKQSRFHPRCGTSFILIVFTISIIVYTFVPKQESFWINLSLRLAFLPLIAGISYEYLKLSASYSKNTLVKALIAPGLWFQRLTTREPDKTQLETGLKSLTQALKAENI